VLFEVQVLSLKLLRMNIGRNDFDKTHLMPEMDTLINNFQECRAWMI